MAISSIPAPAMMSRASSEWRFISSNSAGIERAGLEQDGVGDADLADVVQHARRADHLEPLAVDPELDRERAGVAGDALGVRMGVAVLGVDGARERVDRVDEAGAEVALGGLRGREGEVDRLRVDEGAVLAVRLRPVHGAVGEVHEPGLVGGVLGEADDAGAHGQRLAGAGLDLRGAAADPRHDLGGLLRVRAGEGDHELVAADAAAQVVRAQILGDGAREPQQRVVAGGVAERVVDDLEVVDVERHQRQRRLLAAAAAELLRQALLEGAMVEVAGEGVLERLDQVVGEGIEGARELADLVLALQRRRARLSPPRMASATARIRSSGRTIEAPEQQRDEQAEQRRAAEGGDEDRGAIGAQGGVAALEVVVQLERRQRRAPAGALDRVVELGVVDAVAGADLAEAVAALVDRGGPRAARRGERA